MIQKRLVAGFAVVVLSFLTSKFPHVRVSYNTSLLYILYIRAPYKRSLLSPPPPPPPPCVCVCVCVCEWERERERERVIHKYMPLYRHTYSCMFVYTYVCVCACVCMYVCIYIYIYMCVCVCVCVCICVCVCYTWSAQTGISVRNLLSHAVVATEDGPKLSHCLASLGRQDLVQGKCSSIKLLALPPIVCSDRLWLASFTAGLTWPYHKLLLLAACERAASFHSYCWLKSLQRIRMSTKVAVSTDGNFDQWRKRTRFISFLGNEVWLDISSDIINFNHLLSDTRARANTHTRARAHTHTHVHTHVTREHTQMHAHVHTCARAPPPPPSPHTHTHTYIQTHASTMPPPGLRYWSFVSFVTT